MVVPRGVVSTRRLTMAPSMDEQLAELERAMGVVRVGEGGLAEGEEFDGEIEPDDEAAGRVPVVYEDDCDALLSPLQSPPPSGLTRSPPSALTERDAGAQGGDELSVLTAGLLGGLGASSGADGLIKQLESMAEALEEESGEVEHGIRSQIAQLRGVLGGQAAAVAAHAAKLADAPAEEVFELAHADADAMLQRIEGDLSKVDEALASDTGAAQMLGSLLRHNHELATSLVPSVSEADTGDESHSEAPLAPTQQDGDRAESANWGPLP